MDEAAEVAWEEIDVGGALPVRVLGTGRRLPGKEAAAARWLLLLLLLLLPAWAAAFAVVRGVACGVALGARRGSAGRGLSAAPRAVARGGCES